MQKNYELHIEVKIQQYLTIEDRSISWLCKKMHWQRTKWYRFMNNGLIEVNDLRKISILLNHDFFQYYSFSLSDKTPDL
jgi:hypothetical protein